MEPSLDSRFEEATKQLHFRRVFQHADKKMVVVYLISQTDWRPLRASWWTEKEAHIIGSDLEGNFFLRHCDGTVRYWSHKEQSDEVVATSVRNFLSQLKEETSD